MRIRKFLFPLMCFVFMALFAFANEPAEAETPQIYKQLAAAPEDMAFSQPVVSAELGNRSHSAMIQVELVNGVWQGEIALESAENIKLMTLSNGQEWSLILQSEAGQTVELNPSSRAAQASSLGIANNSYEGIVYSLDDLSAGRWSVTLQGDSSRASQPGFLLYSNGDAVTKLYTYMTDFNLVGGSAVGVRAYTFEDQSAKGAPAITAKRINSAAVTLTSPDGSQATYPMSLLADGSYGYDWQSLPAGLYTAQVMVSGVNSAGEAFQRSTEHLFPVVDETVSLGATADSVVLNEQRLQFNLAVAEAKAGTFKISAELWGMNAGQAVPIAWLGGMSDVTNGSLPLTVDGRWIGRANATAPFSLRNVRISDVDTSVVVAEQAQINLAVNALPAAASLRSAEITQDMLMGSRPERDLSRTGGKLYLVHGYCSTDVWHANQFSNTIEFAQYNVSISHDAFAREIRRQAEVFGAPSYNIVAHSQGGAASLHLYTNYWSGLDYANTSRLIQSVGTPYQGTMLAGNLAAIGNIFGVGCGKNTDLTYNGAAAWLSGIPTWARDDVWYATTSFTDRLWSYDYCSLATDLLLDDPDDGVTEKAYGQLPSANNMGHKTGWCHTASMRDPHQTTDQVRNTKMNSYGDTRVASSPTAVTTSGQQTGSTNTPILLVVLMVTLTLSGIILRRRQR
ncbi:MAG TPA: conditioned medium factor [Anaerolineae bacterium]|nr:conditioned medium factor [Anaerolineae bacterium]